MACLTGEKGKETDTQHQENETDILIPKTGTLTPKTDTKHQDPGIGTEIEKLGLFQKI